MFAKSIHVLTNYFTGPMEHDGATIQVKPGKELECIIGLMGNKEHDCATIQSKTDKALDYNREGLTEYDSALNQCREGNKLDITPEQKGSAEHDSAANNTRTSRALEQAKSKIQKSRIEQLNRPKLTRPNPYLGKNSNPKTNKPYQPQRGWQPMGRPTRLVPLSYESSTPNKNNYITMQP